MSCCTTMEKREGAVTRAEPTRTGQVYLPNVDILENREEILLIADVPGATSENINIQYESGELAIRAKITPRRPEDTQRFLWREYGVGDFCRSFELGEAIDHSKIHADVKNGVLTVHLPKTEGVKPRKIAVKSE